MTYVLNHTSTRLRALVSQVRHRDAKARLIGIATARVAGEDFPALEGLADDRVRSGVDDGDICVTRVGRVDLVGDGNDFAGGVGVQLVAGGVGELVAFAEVEDAVRCVRSCNGRRRVHSVGLTIGRVCSRTGWRRLASRPGRCRSGRRFGC